MTMAKHNASNERIKREYLRYLKEARGLDEATLDRAAMSLARFEASSGRKDFKRFHREQAMAFKRQLGEAINARSGERLSKATVRSMLSDLKVFFEWLSREPGLRSHITSSDADYFNQSEKDAASTRAKRTPRSRARAGRKPCRPSSRSDTFWPCCPPRPCSSAEIARLSHSRGFPAHVGTPSPASK
jgi:hypothetical protein